MNSLLSKAIVAFLIASLLVFPSMGINGEVKAQDGFPPMLEPSLSADGLELANGVPTLVIMDDPNPEKQGIKIAGPTAADALAAPEAATATFSITYVAAGGTDPWNEPCYTFPAAAKTAFSAAAAIWANKLQSSVPVTIKACWADLGSSSGILGYSGGAYSYRNFTGAPKADTWYESSLANSLAGSDLGPSYYDMNITYNQYFTWYFGTDANPPAGQHDFISVAAHEIAHGLNFSGTADYYSGGTGSVGMSGSPNIYDTFMEDGAGTALTSYANPSVSLGSLLTSGDLWFDGPNADAANGGARVKMYAPGTWSGGSSYSHLDYSTFNGTVNSLMVYAISSGSANHNPGPVTLGIFKDLGWKQGVATTPTPQSPTGTISDTTPTYKWSKVAGATQYRYQLMKGVATVYTKTVPSTACGASACTNTPANVLGLGVYKWRVQAMTGGVWRAYSAFKAFTVSLTPKPLAPAGAISDKTPTYKWTKIPGATQYRYQLMKGAVLVYTKTAPAAACGATTCSNTPADVLSTGAHKWRVQALVGGVWRAYSPYKAFSIAAAGPTPGFWESTTGDEFYVTTDRKFVDDFAIYLSVTGCGYYKITHTIPEPITNNHFGFTGSYYANGTFTTPTSASGQDGLSSFYLPYCGYVTGGPWNYTAIWKNSSQPFQAALVQPEGVIDWVTLVQQEKAGFHVVPLEGIEP